MRSAPCADVCTREQRPRHPARGVGYGSPQSTVDCTYARTMQVTIVRVVARRPSTNPKIGMKVDKAG